MTELLPCPFCKSKAYINTIKDFINSSYFYYRVVCSKCSISTQPYENQDYAIEIWNTRAEPKPMPIDTAPMNGTYILLYVNNRWVIGRYMVYDWVFEFDIENYKPPTHWLPLPPKPE